MPNVPRREIGESKLTQAIRLEFTSADGRKDHGGSPNCFARQVKTMVTVTGSAFRLRAVTSRRQWPLSFPPLLVFAVLIPHPSIHTQGLPVPTVQDSQWVGHRTRGWRWTNT